MVTTFLSPEEVRSYLCDLVGRLVRLDPQPEVIFAMARSGTRLLEELVSLLPEYAPALATR